MGPRGAAPPRAAEHEREGYDLSGHHHTHADHAATAAGDAGGSETGLRSALLMARLFPDAGGTG